MSDALACRDRKKESAADKRRWTPILVGARKSAAEFTLNLTTS